MLAGSTRISTRVGRTFDDDTGKEFVTSILESEEGQGAPRAALSSSAVRLAVLCPSEHRQSAGARVALEMGPWLGALGR